MKTAFFIRRLVFNLICIVSCCQLLFCRNGHEHSRLVFVSWFESGQQMQHCLRLCESIRTFAGAMRNLPIEVYYHEHFLRFSEEDLALFKKEDVSLNRIEIPSEALKYALGAKPYIAARAETDLETRTSVLAFLDANAIIIGEPEAFILPDDHVLAYKPVFHQNIGSLYVESPDGFWSRVYTVLDVAEESLFPMEAVADKKVLRPYFNAGFLSVRPERALLRAWRTAFEVLAGDEIVADISADGLHNVFLHQAALTGALLKGAAREEMRLLPFSYNYPLFFDRIWESELTFHSVENIVSLKCEIDFSKLPSDWRQMIKGPEPVVRWLRERLEP